MTDNGYHRWIHRFGISSSLLLLVAMTAFPVAISLEYGRILKRYGLDLLQ